MKKSNLLFKFPSTHLIYLPELLNLVLEILSKTQNPVHHYILRIVHHQYSSQSATALSSQNYEVRKKYTVQVIAVLIFWLLIFLFFEDLSGVCLL